MLHSSRFCLYRVCAESGGMLGIRGCDAWEEGMHWEMPCIVLLLYTVKTSVVLSSLATGSDSFTGLLH